MSLYQHILVAVDLTRENTQLANKAKAIASVSDATITLIHVIEPLGYAYGGDIPMDLTEVQEELESRAREQLAELGNLAGIDKAHQEVIIGRPATEIHDFARDQGVDLIIVGSHGRHGLQLLLGSTANSVLHGAGTDVLAVRISDEDS